MRKKKFNEKKSIKKQSINKKTSIFMFESEIFKRDSATEKNSFKKIKFTKVAKMPKDIFKIYKVDDKTLLDVQFALSSH